MKLDKKLFNNIKKDDISFITIDGITCSGKSICAKLLEKKLKKKIKNVMILSKDLFLRPRKERIRITSKINKSTVNQNQLHYDLIKLRLVLNFLKKKSNKKFITLKNLYNRKTGINNLHLKIHFSDNRLVIFEGIFVNEDVKFILNPILKILIIEKIYESLARKIERIRDKKISIQLVITEFIKIHLVSFKHYLLKYNFDISIENLNGIFVKSNKSKPKQIAYIKMFFLKHRY